MASTRVARCVAVAVGIAAISPCAAFAVSPPNDNYLSSTSILDASGFPTSWRDVQNTADATTQPDVLNPDRHGAVLGGGPPETTRCGATVFGKTVWYDFSPPLAGAVELTASGFDTVIAVYEYDVETARIVKQVACQNATSGVAEDFALPTNVLNDHAYTVQVGGAVTALGAASGNLDFSFNFFPDRDGDGELDQLDHCKEQAGTVSGCPPDIKAALRYTWSPAASGIRLKSLSVIRVPRGGRVEAHCRKCRLTQVVRATPGVSVVRLTRFIGPALPVGAALEIRVTRPASNAGRYQYGAIGEYFRFKANPQGLGKPLERCLKPGSDTPRTKCS
jgi:hypothetical protein